MLVPILKDRLAGRKFDCLEDLSKAVKSQLEGIPREEPQRALQTRRKWLKICIRVNGEYFEGM